MRRHIALHRLLPMLLLAVCTSGVLGAGSGETGPTPAPEDPEGPSQVGKPPFPGMITASYVFASDSAGPSTRGIRLGYGYMGGKADDYPWGEFWVSYRENSGFDITSAGLGVVPIALLRDRFDLGLLLDLGLSRRREGDRSVVAGLIGAGAEGAVRMSRRWDLLLTAEAAYRTTNDVELQGRVGVRFHDDRLPRMRRR